MEHVSTAPESPQQPEAAFPAAPAQGSPEQSSPAEGFASDEQFVPADMQQPAEPQRPIETPEPIVTQSQDEVRVRRAPKYPVFIILGVLVGIVVTAIAVNVAPGKYPGENILPIFGYFALYGITFGALLGALVAVLADWVSSRRAKRVEVERTSVEIQHPDEVVEGDLE
jgi:hypothetical protein